MRFRNFCDNLVFAFGYAWSVFCVVAMSINWSTTDWSKPLTVCAAILSCLLTTAGTIRWLDPVVRWTLRTIDRVTEWYWMNQKIRWIDGTSVRRKEVLWI